MKKKGMAPLVATLLLIVFAIALGIVIMSFGRAQIEEEAKCPLNPGLKLAVVTGEKQVCLDKKKEQVFFIVENGVHLKIEGLVVNLIGGKQVKTYELKEAKIERAGTYLKYLPYVLEEMGELRQIKIIPQIKLYGEEMICLEKALILEGIKEC